MIVDNIFSEYVSKEATDKLRSTEKEFNEALGRNSLTRSLCRRHSDALMAYKDELRECPFWPSASRGQPVTVGTSTGGIRLPHDPSIDEEMNRLLVRIEEEGRRVSEHEKMLPPGKD